MHDVHVDNIHNVHVYGDNMRNLRADIVHKALGDDVHNVYDNVHNIIDNVCNVPGDIVHNDNVHSVHN